MCQKSDQSRELHTTPHCNALQRTAMHCNVKWERGCVTKAKHHNTLQRTHCNTLQHVQHTHCNTLQHRMQRQRRVAKSCWLITTQIYSCIDLTDSATWNTSPPRKESQRRKENPHTRTHTNTDTHTHQQKHNNSTYCCTVSTSPPSLCVWQYNNLWQGEKWRILSATPLFVWRDSFKCETWLPYMLTHCNTLQHTHCNTLQHTATHCNTL